MSKPITDFNKLVEHFSKLNVNDHVKKKNNLTYLSWTYAWAEVLKVCPDASYEVRNFTNAETGDVLPYQYDPTMGYMVWTEVTMLGQTKCMWLPVMDGANMAMKAQPYTFTTKWNKEKQVDAASMFDVNKTIMRCLVKNLAMFGLGAYIYAGEDLPEDESKKPTEPKPVAKKDEEKPTQTNEKAELKTLKVNKKDTDYVNVRKYIDQQAAAGKDAEFIANNVAKRFTVSPSFKKHIEKCVAEQQPAEATA